MAPALRNPAGQSRVSRDLLGGSSHSPPTPMDWRAQWVAGRYCLLLSIARAVSSHLFGGAGHD